MKKKLINNVHIEGYLYDYDLKKKQTGENSKAPGTEFISGEIRIATDEKITNIIPIHFTYETALFSKSGKENTRFTILSKIMDGELSAYTKNPDAPAMLRIDTSCALNDFYVKNEQTQEDELRSPIRLESGFMHVVNVLNENEAERCKFTMDIVLDKIIRKSVMNQVTEEAEEKAYLHGYTFDDFRKMTLPVDLMIVDNDGAKDYFDSLGISTNTPVFTQVSGILFYKDVMTSIVKKGAFGDSIVQKPVRSRDWIVTWAAEETYPEFEDENAATLGITAEELSTMIGNRNIYLDDVKRRRDEYEAEKAKTAAKPAGPSAIPTGNYNFF